MFDNRIFAVNGSGEENLLKALELAFLQRTYRSDPRCIGWTTSEKGLVLKWAVGSNDTTTNKFPGNGLLVSEVFPIVWSWLQTPKIIETVELVKWEGNADHDGHNTVGWEVYVEDWGHVGGDSYAICAVKPVYLWHGK